MAQQPFTAKAVDGLVLGSKGYAAGLRENGLLIQQQHSPDFISDDVDQLQWRLMFAPRDSSWSVYRPAAPIQRGNGYVAAIGTILGGSDSCRVFAQGGNLWLCSLERHRMLPPQPLFDQPFEDCRILSPALSPDGSQIVFASDGMGGEGGLDLFVTNLLPEGSWSLPVSLGSAVNTSGDEVFPSWNGNQLYFSSDGHPGAGRLDICRMDRQSQFKEIEVLPEPFNSSEDDFLPLWLSSNDALLTSARSGKHTVYRLKTRPEQSAAHRYTAVLECKGTPVQGARVTIENDLREEIVKAFTDDTGRFDLAPLQPGRRYRARFEKVNPEILEASLLYILDETGKRVMVLRPDGKGFFWFELLPFSDEDLLPFAENIDESRLLKVAVEGQVFEEVPGDIGRGEPISIVGPDGSLMALAYTKAEGKFSFKDLSPQARYTLQMDEQGRSLKVTIFDEGEGVTLNADDGETVFERVAEEDGLELLSENGERIVVRRDDLFVIRNIYYAIDRYDLNAAARYELDRLTLVLEQNPNLHIELGSHTDARGKKEYNQKLSEMRAVVAVEYLQSKGIDADRMSATGYGEEELLNECADGIECPEDQHAVNRRTEIRLISGTH